MRARRAPCGYLLRLWLVDGAGVRLAVDVLAGGEHPRSPATEFAGRVLDATRREAWTVLCHTTLKALSPMVWANQGQLWILASVATLRRDRMGRTP